MCLYQDCGATGHLHQGLRCDDGETPGDGSGQIHVIRTHQHLPPSSFPFSSITFSFPFSCQSLQPDSEEVRENHQEDRGSSAQHCQRLDLSSLQPPAQPVSQGEQQPSGLSVFTVKHYRWEILIEN